MVLYDRFGRAILNLRIAITDRCNLNCIYCHHEGEYITSQCSKENSNVELTVDEIERVIRIAAELGIKKVKITGGEPLIRKDVVDIVDRISSIPGIIEVSMVTNGLLLERYALKLKKAGLKRINISLPSPIPEKYKEITGYPLLDGPERVIRCIKEAIKSKLYPVKINMVILKGINDVDIEAEMKIAKELGAILQLIELQDPSAKSDFFQKYHHPLIDVESELSKRAKKIIIRELHHRKKFFLENGLEVEVVRPMHNSEFCKYCTRLRITSKGEFKPCLLRNDNHVPFLDALRKNVSDDTLKKLMIDAIMRREPYFKDNSLVIKNEYKDGGY